MLIVVDALNFHLPSFVMPRASSINAKPFGKPKSFASASTSCMVHERFIVTRSLT